ncbi:MAG: hypothetical protein ACYCQI_02375 [Gammaproteobacteria bacterium]
MMKPQKNEDRISKIMNNPKEVEKILKAAINDALLKHKQAGNPVCGFKDGKIYWIQPQDLTFSKK